jgi:spore coat polysaccharide biosynthesis predicted glycosyltransferase SpsG
MIWLRCKAGLQIGTGHAVRCLALARAIQAEGGEAGIIFDETNAPFLAQAETSGIPAVAIAPRDHLADEVAEFPDGPVLVDLSNPLLLEQLSGLIAALQTQGRKTALIEGLDREAYLGPAEPELVITPYIGAEEETPRPAKRWIGGGRYAVLGPEYEARPSPLDQRDGVLVMLSGSDPWHLTEQVIGALAARGGELRIAIGNSVPQDRVRKLAAAVEVIGATPLISPDGLFDHFNAARACILGPGLAKYEAVATGTPAVIVCPDARYAAMQSAFILEGLGQLINAEDTDMDAQLTAALDQALAETPEYPGPIDGQGARRVARELIHTFGE